MQKMVDIGDDRDGKQLFRSLANVALSSAGFYQDKYNPSAGRLAQTFQIQRADFTLDHSPYASACEKIHPFNRRGVLCRSALSLLL